MRSSSSFITSYPWRGLSRSSFRITYFMSPASNHWRRRAPPPAHADPRGTTPKPNPLHPRCIPLLPSKDVTARYYVTIYRVKLLLRNSLSCFGLQDSVHSIHSRYAPRSHSSRPDEGVADVRARDPPPRLDSGTGPRAGTAPPGGPGDAGSRALRGEHARREAHARFPRFLLSHHPRFHAVAGATAAALPGGARGILPA